MKLFHVTLLLAICGITHTASANSYLEMITTPPIEQTAKDSYFDGLDTIADSPQNVPLLWYDRNITTHGPVVFSDYPKYMAWKQAKERENYLQFDSHEFIQDLIYNVEGGLAIWGIYQIYKYH